MSKRQLDMFASDDPELFDAAPAVGVADPDRVRRRLGDMLTEIRYMDARSWQGSRRRFIETVVPQMSLWLPEEEARQYQMQFAEELARFN